jgi:hypothetical protein
MFQPAPFRRERRWPNRLAEPCFSRAKQPISMDIAQQCTGRSHPEPERRSKSSVKGKDGRPSQGGSRRRDENRVSELLARHKN